MFSSIYKKKMISMTKSYSSYEQLQSATVCMRDFSALAREYHQTKSDKTIALLQHKATILSTNLQPQQFICIDGNAIEVTKFFIDLHTVISTLPIESDALWACVAVLQHCTRSLHVRRVIIEDHRFLPLLAVLLERTQAEDKLARLLLLLQELTYEARITWEEPYIHGLVRKLVDIAEDNNKNYKNGQGQLAVSVLIQLCFKNFIVMYVLRRTVSISKFCKNIQEYGTLTNKLILMLSDELQPPPESELQLILRHTLRSVCDGIKQWNVPQLSHVLDFLSNANTYHGFNETLLNYTQYSEDLEQILNQLDVSLDVSKDSMDQEVNRQRQQCIAVVLRLLNFICSLISESEDKNKENSDKLSDQMQRMYGIICTLLETDPYFIEAVILLEGIVRYAPKQAILENITHSPSTIVQLINISEQPETPSANTSAILQLLLTLLRQTKTRKLVLSKVTESYFDKVLAPLTNTAPDMHASKLSTLPLEEVEKSVYCLLLLTDFAGIAAKAYQKKCTALLELPQVVRALAQATKSENNLVCAAVFKISQCDNFPREEVTKHMAALNATQTQMITTPSSPVSPTAHGNLSQLSVGPYVDWRYLNTILKSERTFASKDSEQRVQALIELFTRAQQNKEINNVAISQVIELFQYKTEQLSCVEESYKQRLECASSEITNLMQRIDFQKAEIQKHQMLHLQQSIEKESLQSQYQDLQQQKNSLKENFGDVMKKLTDCKETLRTTEKRLKIKLTEVIDLDQKYRTTKAEYDKQSTEFEKYQTMHKENVARIEKQKKSIATFEAELTAKMRLLDLKQSELTEVQKALKEEKELKLKAEDVVTALEAQLLEKNEQIRAFEEELTETEALRKTIMSLMESKPIKRKKGSDDKSK